MKGTGESSRWFIRVVGLSSGLWFRKVSELCGTGFKGPGDDLVTR